MINLKQKLTIKEMRLHMSEIYLHAFHSLESHPVFRIITTEGRRKKMAYLRTPEQFAQKVFPGK